MAKKITIKKDRSLTPEKIMKLITDATEIKIQRPKNCQKKFYSGKKKTHTIKSEIRHSSDQKEKKPAANQRRKALQQVSCFLPCQG